MNMSLKWKEAFESKGLKINLGKNKAVISGSITKDGTPKGNDPSGVCCLRAMVDSNLYVKCGKWIHSRCSGVKRVNQQFSGNFICKKCEGNIGDAVEQKETLCDEVKTVREFTIIGDRDSAGGGCEAAVTARTRRGLAKLRECGELLCDRRFRLKLNGVVHKSYVKPAMLYGIEEWCLRETEMGVLVRTERSMVRAMCGIQHKDRKKIYGFDVHVGFH